MERSQPCQNGILTRPRDNSVHAELCRAHSNNRNANPRDVLSPSALPPSPYDGAMPSFPLASPINTEERTSRAVSKTPRFRQRVFASLERKADKMINLLTPKKIRNDGPTTLKCTKVS